jgi:hypothetical protein
MPEGVLMKNKNNVYTMEDSRFINPRTRQTNIFDPNRGSNHSKTPEMLSKRILKIPSFATKVGEMDSKFCQLLGAIEEGVVSFPPIFQIGKANELVRGQQHSS